MTRERAKELLPVITAYVEGRDVQLRPVHQQTWDDVRREQTVTFADEWEYRIKPEPKYRAWKPEEVPLLAYVRAKKCDGYNATLRAVIIAASDKAITCSSGSDGVQHLAPENMLERIEHSLDGGKTWGPCGVLEQS